MHLDLLNGIYLRATHSFWMSLMAGDGSSIQITAVLRFMKLLFTIHVPSHI